MWQVSLLPSTYYPIGIYNPRHLLSAAQLSDKTPSPPRPAKRRAPSALRSPLSPKGERAGVYTFSPPTLENLCPRPLGGEGGPPPAFSSAGAGRVRGSKPNDLNPTPPVATTQSLAPFARITPGPEEPNRGGLAARCIPRSSGARRVSQRSSLGSAVRVHRRRARPSGAAPDSKSRQGKVPPGAGGGT